VRLSIRTVQGGWGLLQLHRRNATACAGDGGACSVHVDVLPAMTGVSRFGEQPGWVYFKTEGLTDAGLLQHGFALLLSAKERVDGFVRQEAVDGFAKLRLQRAAWPPLTLDTVPQVFIHARAT
jgi:hypothetical protein